MDEDVRIIDASSARRGVGFAALWQHRDLLYFLTRRNVLARYRQAVLGVLWAVIQPVMTMVVFSFLLGEWAKMPSEGVPYPVFALLGILPWGFFTASLNGAVSGIGGNSHLIQRVYFPRALIPLSATFAALVDLAIAGCVLVVVLFSFGIAPAWTTFLCLPLLVLIGLVGTGIGMGLAALNVRWRDVGHAVPFALQILMFATPVVYSKTVPPRGWANVLAFNPLTAPVQGFRQAVLGGSLDFPALGVSAATGVLLAAAGFWLFRRTERYFADFV